MVLVLGAIVLLGAVGYAIGLITQQGPAWLIFGLALAVALSAGSYLYGDRIVLSQDIGVDIWAKFVRLTVMSGMTADVAATSAMEPTTGASAGIPSSSRTPSGSR